MVKINGKDWKKIKKIKISPIIKKESLTGKDVEKKSEPPEEELNNLKFLEFLTPSIESIHTLASKKPKAIKNIEQDEELLSFVQKNKASFNADNIKEKKDYFVNNSKEYDLISSREETKQNSSSILIVPKRVDFTRIGRNMNLPHREIFKREVFEEDSSNQRREEKNYNLEKVDFTEVGREKRYRSMK